MKLRLTSNTLRLRLSDAEVARFAEAGRFEEIIRFGPEPNQFITYGVEVSDRVDEVGIRFHTGHITVLLPRETAAAWTGSDEVGITAQHPIGQGAHLNVIVEKDLGKKK